MKDILNKIFVGNLNGVVKQKKRENAILNVVEKYGYEIKRKVFVIGFLTLAYYLNNSWKAPLFIKNPQKNKKIVFHDRWAVDNFNLELYKRIITRTINKMKNAKKINGSYETYYKFKDKK